MAQLALAAMATGTVDCVDEEIPLEPIADQNFNRRKVLDLQHELTRLQMLGANSVRKGSLISVVSLSSFNIICSFQALPGRYWMGKSQGLCPVGKRHTYIITPIIEMANGGIKIKSWSEVDEFVSWCVVAKENTLETPLEMMGTVWRVVQIELLCARSSALVCCWMEPDMSSPLAPPDCLASLFHGYRSIFLW